MVDIRALNDLLVPDAHLLPLQLDIIATLQGCTHISVLDAASFFYQWHMHPDHQYLFIVVTHRGQETFKVPIIGCINSIVYIQRQINRILRLLLYSRAYIDDIVSSTRSFTEHLSNLRNLFRTLVEANVLISPRKVFLGYPDIKLLR